MAREITFFLDSGANIHSMYKQTYTLDELNLTDEEWDEMSESDKHEFAKEIAWDRMDWGFYEEE